MTEPRTIAVLTTGRQDWGILRSTAAAIRDHPALRLRLLAGGTHVTERHGDTVQHLRDDGFELDAVLDWMQVDGNADGDAVGAGDLPADVQAGRALQLVGAELRREPPDALLLAGDRFETAAAALAATVDRVPIIHLHGGEQTLGAFDDALRHAITKLSHLHLVSHEEHARRIIAMGEDPSTVIVVGAPGLDAAARSDLPDRAALGAFLELELESPVVIVTVHPTTLDPDPAATARAVVEAMDRVPATYVVTLPNADPGAAEVRALLEGAVHGSGRVAVEALGSSRFWGLMQIADAMLGNSSSAIVEAPAVDLPAVDVGDRQSGRRRQANVIPAGNDPDAVAAALRTALDPAFRARAREARPRLADGLAGARIAAIIAGWHPSRPPRKAPVAIPDEPA